ncbi:alpha-amylase family glycosyl hydrolase [Pseudofrankia asymbiotica]|uniref:alpha-amylase family glycosyl hydrolase n=1 Tax=Pseudofrankia asymbiotica TaxID=1834516 RepID=UPI0009776B7A|nr:alpha-amylase family glycosyl hydrolase [Pseudofrankia asymbiotica]
MALTAGWWRDAVFYEVYVRSFADADGDGVGDLDGIRARLPDLAELGVDGIWLTPFYPSPMADHGYDVADHRDVDPLFGDLAAFDALLAEAHRLDLAVLVDLVPNHSSDAHPAFQAALAAPPGDPARHRYLIRPGQGPGGLEPPNNWISTFGGGAWTRLDQARRLPGPAGSQAAAPPASGDDPAGQDEPAEWYLHLFAPEQPDWNWSDPAVRADHERTLRFWLDRGVDGFRIDVSHGLVKDGELRDNPPGPPATPATSFRERLEPHVWDQEGVHDVYRSWRTLVDGYQRDDGRERVLVGETWVEDPDRLARYVRPDELHLTFAFSLLTVEWSAPRWRQAVQEGLAATAAVGAPPTWVLASHDATRPVTRYGGGATGLRRARAALLTLLALPGVVFLYQGDELALPQVDVPPEARQDPVWERSGRTETGRDGCRVPIPWAGARPPYDFAAPGVVTWLPQPDDWAQLTVEAQRADPASTWRLVHDALATRRDLSRGANGGPPLRWLDTPPDVLAFDHPAGPADGTEVLTCVLATATETRLALPGRLLLASGPAEHDGETLVIPPDTAAWIIREAADGEGPDDSSMA